MGPRRGGETITTSCSETSSATVTPPAVLTLFKRSPKLDLLLAADLGGGVLLVVVLDLLSSAGFGAGVTCPAERGGSEEVDPSSCATLSSLGQGWGVDGESEISWDTGLAASSAVVLVEGSSTVALRCLCLVLVLLEG